MVIDAGADPAGRAEISAPGSYSLEATVTKTNMEVNLILNCDGYSQKVD